MSTTNVVEALRPIRKSYLVAFPMNFNRLIYTIVPLRSVDSTAFVVAAKTADTQTKNGTTCVFFMQVKAGCDVSVICDQNYAMQSAHCNGNT